MNNGVFKMSRRVALVRTDVSAELSASIIMVTKLGELGLDISSQRASVTFLVHIFLSS
jgi:hypothetical protein